MTLRRLSSAGQRRECDEAALPQLRRGVAINKPLHSIAIPGQRKQLRAEREGEIERASEQADGREGRDPRHSPRLRHPAMPTAKIP